MLWHWFCWSQSFHLLSPYAATGASTEAMAASGLNGTSLLSSTAGLPAGLAAAAGAFNAAGGLTAAGLSSATPPTMTMQSMTMQPAMASIAPPVPNISKLQELYTGSTFVSTKGFAQMWWIPSLSHSFNCVQYLPRYFWQLSTCFGIPKVS